MTLMTVYILLLRGVNVSGKNLIKMEQLRRMATDIGAARAETYLQSGNLIVQTKVSAKTFAAKLEKALAKAGIQTTVIARSVEEMEAIAVGNPLLEEKGVDASKLHVFFPSEPPSQAGLEKIAKIPAGDDYFAFNESHIYLYCPGGYGKTKLSNANLEKALAAPGATRNWNTTLALARMARGR